MDRDRAGCTCPWLLGSQIREQGTSDLRSASVSWSWTGKFFFCCVDVCGKPLTTLKASDAHGQLLKPVSGMAGRGCGPARWLPAFGGALAVLQRLENGDWRGIVPGRSSAVPVKGYIDVWIVAHAIDLLR